MTRRVLYMAHPVAPTAEEIAAFIDSEHQARPRTAPEKVHIAIRRNLDSALRWLAWLRASFPETTFIAPWISCLQSGEDDSDPAARERGLVDCCAAVERCDGIVLVGGRISSGMQREMEHGMKAGGRWIKGSLGYLVLIRFNVYDLTQYQIEGDSGRNADGRTFEEWMDCYRESCTR